MNHELKIYSRKAFFIFIILNFNFPFVQGQSATSASGDWSSGGNWSGGVPGDSDDATVDHDMTVDTDLTMDGSAVWTINNPTTDIAGGSAYGITIKNSSDLQVNGDLTFEGNAKISNSANLNVNACATLTVGDFEIENTTTVTIAACAKLIVNGDLLVKNNIGIVCDGQICVNGNVTAENSAAITGSGGLTATGTVDINNSASIFGSTSDCTSPPCIIGVPLPIELLFFEAHLDESNRNVLLSWETASEINNDYFTVQRSTNGSDWQDLEIIDGAGNSSVTQMYQTIDHFPLSGISYYRLIQTDFDGNFEIFKPVAINIGQLELRDELVVFPNPSTSNLIRIYSPKYHYEEVNITLVSAHGQEVYTEVGVNTNDGLILLELPFTPEAGLYMIVVNDYATPIVWQ